MAKKKLPTSELLRRVDAGESYSEIARDYGISKQAVHKRFLALRGRTTKVIVAQKVEESVTHRLDAIAQLHGINKKTLELLDTVGNDPSLALKCIAEVRCQLKLSLEIFESMYSLQHVEGFIQTVKDVLKEVDPDVYKKVIRRLNEERSLKEALRFA